MPEIMNPQSDYTITDAQIKHHLETYGDFHLYRDPENANHLIYNGARALNKLKLWSWIRDLELNNGFFLSKNNHVHALAAELEPDGHSALSFAATMRKLQTIAGYYLNRNSASGIINYCSICLSEKNPNDRVLYECNHSFHNSCMKEYYKNTHQTEMSCPLCRSKIPDNNTR
jgi:hypothetical protein